MSLVVPLTNSLTFVFTALTSMWMGEAHTHNASQRTRTALTHPAISSSPLTSSLTPPPSLPFCPAVWLGMSLIVLGTGVCLSSKQQPP